MKYFKKINITSKGQCLSIRLGFFEKKDNKPKDPCVCIFFPFILRYI